MIHRQNAEAFLDFLEKHSMPVSICKSMDLLAIPTHFKAQGVRFNHNGDASIRDCVGEDLQLRLFGSTKLFSPYGDCALDKHIKKDLSDLKLLRARFTNLLKTFKD